MALVDYSDSEESGDEKPQTTVEKPLPKTNLASTGGANFSRDKTNPRKIRVNLGDVVPQSARNDEDGEPAAKRPRIGGGGVAGFNAMLPAPKRDTENKNQRGAANTSTRKVFSLKTGAEPGFSRESDAELRQFFAEQDEGRQNPSQLDNDADTGIPQVKKTATLATEQPAKSNGNVFLFKPLSVARNPKKNKNKPLANGAAKSSSAVQMTATSLSSAKVPVPQLPAKKISLFSAGRDDQPHIPEAEETPDPDEAEGDDYENHQIDGIDQQPTSSSQNPNLNLNEPQTLTAIASDLNLSAADRRQLFGRNNHRSSSAKGTAINVVNFNTDAEYAANEELRAAGEQVQHNPVRAIAPGKHSLKQLVSAASGQKEALEESFAAGRRNKKEAGNKYGW